MAVTVMVLVRVSARKLVYAEAMAIPSLYNTGTTTYAYVMILVPSTYKWTTFYKTVYIYSYHMIRVPSTWYHAIGI